MILEYSYFISPTHFLKSFIHQPSVNFSSPTIHKFFKLAYPCIHFRDLSWRGAPLLSLIPGTLTLYSNLYSWFYYLNLILILFLLWYYFTFLKIRRTYDINVQILKHIIIKKLKYSPSHIKYANNLYKMYFKFHCCQGKLLLHIVSQSIKFIRRIFILWQFYF